MFCKLPGKFPRLFCVPCFLCCINSLEQRGNNHDIIEGLNVVLYLRDCL